ncbi:MAG: hypothetical protein FRX48_01197 [Lasallia pustulata]|uniref:Uncharacterized protein n=1 Tax=Lasallia pustulata TaxID=136370 RepID=A0A5M8PZT4_9LECA|nr:MAG: hypothetical protein FRX48_01197 [Lasallia pustulata]
MTDPNEAHPFTEEFPLLTAIISPETFDEAYITHPKDLKNKVAHLCNKYQTSSVQYTELYNSHDALLVDDQAYKKEQNTLARKLSETTVDVSTGLRNSPGASPKEESTRGSGAGSWHQIFFSQASFRRDIL